MREIVEERSQEDRLLTPKDLAEFLNISIRTVWAWALEGRGPNALKVGRQWRYRMSDVEEFLRGRKGA